MPIAASCKVRHWLTCTGAVPFRSTIKRLVVLARPGPLLPGLTKSRKPSASGPTEATATARDGPGRFTRPDRRMPVTGIGLFGLGRQWLGDAVRDHRRRRALLVRIAVLW